MAEYDTFTREQLLEELCRKKAVNEKFKKKLELTQEKCANIQPLLDGYKSLNENHKQRVLECETLRSENSAFEKAHQDADRCVKEQERKLKQLAHDLRRATERADKAEHCSKQAKADCTQSAMVREKLERNLEDLKKQLLSLESALTSVKKQQQEDQRVVTSLRAQASKPAEAHALAPNGSRQACQGCTAAQQAVEELRQQMAPLQRSLSVRGSNLAESMPSTQDRSGDTNDDRDVAQLRSELSGIRHQLAECHEQQGNWLAEMQGWRNTFALLGGVMPSAHIHAPQQTASGQRQVSPVAAEGSNIMPRQAFRPDPAEIRRPCQGSSPLNGAHAPRESTPQAGSTAGDGEDVGRHDTLGAGSDSMSNVVGTAASLMQPACHQPQYALRLLPSQAQPRAQGLSSGLLAGRPLHSLPNRPPAEPEPADGLKEKKRKTIALNPGPVAKSHSGRKRKRPPPKGTDPSQQQLDQQQQQQQPAEQRVDLSEPRQLQQQQSQGAPDNGASQAYLAKFGIHESDATVVDFLEIQLARITDCDEELGPELVSSVAQDICAAWQQSQCPLQCIISAFVCSFLECAAAPYAHSLPASKRSKLGEASQDGEQDFNTEPEAEDSGVPVEDGPMARLWCLSAARQQLTFTWLLHCANELNGLLSSPPPPQPQPGAQTQAAAKGTPSVKRRGRPPGSKNKKTLQRLQQAAGLSLTQQQQQHRGPKALQGSDSAVMRLEPCGLLNGLLQQVLLFLRQSCQGPFPGPFQTEVCCLSATAAALCRLTGKSAGLRAQVLNALRDPDISASTKLLCTAAALETWPEALVPSLDPNMPDDALMHCTLAALQGVVSPVQQDTPAAQSASPPQPDLSAMAAPHPREAVTTTEDRSKLALQDWGRNPFTQTAASQLASMYAQHWQQQPQSRPAGTDAVISCPPKHTDTFWSMAVTSVAANLQGLCAKGELSESCLQKQWTCLHHALELAISCLGWRWGFEQVTGTLIGQKMRATLPPASKDDTWALSTMGHLLRCMKHAAGVIAQVSCKEEETSCYSALKGLAEMLRQAAKTYAHHQGLHDLLNDAAEGVQGSLEPESHQVPASHQLPHNFLNDAATAGMKASKAGCQVPAKVFSAAHELTDNDTAMLQQVEDVIPVSVYTSAGNCKAAAPPKDKRLGVEVEEI